MPLIRKLATLAATAEAARRYAKKNPEKAGKFLDQAAAFVDKQTKGKFRTQIEGAKRSAKGAAGIRPEQAPGPTGPGVAGNGSGQSTDLNSGLGGANLFDPEKPAPGR
jgi:hypothetical protein